MRQWFAPGLLICTLLVQCVSSNKITYNIPADFPEDRKKQALEICEKGRVLYKLHCSECHGIFTAGKDKVPNFTNTQLDNYSSRFIRRDPKNHAVAIEMSEEQLNQVLTFLRFKNPKNKDSVVFLRNRNP